MHRLLHVVKVICMTIELVKYLTPLVFFLIPGFMKNIVLHLTAYAILILSEKRLIG
jgi:hypothetical protein